MANVAKGPTSDSPVEVKFLSRGNGTKGRRIGRERERKVGLRRGFRKFSRNQISIELKGTYDKRRTTLVVQLGAVELLDTSRVGKDLRGSRLRRQTHHERDRSREVLFYLDCDALAGWG